MLQMWGQPPPAVRRAPLGSCLWNHSEFRRKKKGAGKFRRPRVKQLARCVQARRSLSQELKAKSQKLSHLLSATDGLVPKSRRLFTAVRAARALGWFAATAPYRSSNTGAIVFSASFTKIILFSQPLSTRTKSPSFT